MSGKDRKKKKRSTGKDRILLCVAIALFAALLVAECYVMINEPHNYVLLGIFGVCMLVMVYGIADRSSRMQRTMEQQFNEQYEKLFKSAKLSYLYLKKSFAELYEKLGKIDDDSSLPIDELIEAQKAIAKVTINRSKENATALMNSNDQLIDRMFGFEKELKELEQKVLEKQNKEDFDRIIEGMDAMLKDLSEMFEHSEKSLHDEIAQLSGSLQGQIAELADTVQNISVSAPQMAQEAFVQPQETFINEPEPQTAAEEPVVPEAEPVIEEPVVPEAEPVIEEPVVPEPEPVAQEPVVPEPEPVAEEPVVPEPEPAAEEPVVPEAEPVIEEPVVPEPVAEEPEAVIESEDAAAAPEIIEEEIIDDPVAEQEPEVQAKPPMPDLSSDPSHVMTPEEIAALLASM